MCRPRRGVKKLRRQPAAPSLNCCVTRAGFRHLRTRHRLTSPLRPVKSLPRSRAATRAPEVRYCAQQFNDGADKFSFRRVSTFCRQRSSRYSKFRLLQMYRRFGEASSHPSTSLSSSVFRHLHICSSHETCPQPSSLALCANGLACCRNSSRRKDDLDLCMQAHRMNGRRSSLAPLCAKRTKSYAPQFSSRLC